MKTRIILTALWVILGLLTSPASNLVYGGLQAGGDVALSEPAPALHTDVEIVTLKTILESMDELKHQISEKEHELERVKTDDQKARVLKDLAEVNTRLEGLTRNFQQIATGVNLEVFTVKPKGKFDWREEVQDVIGPIVKELKNLTAHPREIESLRGEVAYYESQITTAKGAVQNVEKLLIDTQDQALRSQLESVKKAWKQTEQQIASQLAVVRYQLNEKIGEQKPFLESFQNLMKTFFKSRGKNLILAFIAFVLVWLLLRLLYRLVYRFSPLHRSGERTFYTRLTDLLYYGVSFLGATGASLLVLYVAGDWVLLSVAALFLLGIIWTARQTLPKFWTEAKFFLNMGTVREGERLVYHGIPWQVQSLNFHTELVNSHLKGGMLRLPLRELMDLRSRPFEPEEPWFPCRENEWVILADGTLGQVVMQTPEIVELAPMGGSRKTYPTAGFLTQNPNNISRGFRLSIPFGLDYQHQSESTHDIPVKMRDFIERKLKKETFGKNLLSVSVEFKEAQPSSLELAILVVFTGKAAQHYDTLTRTIPQIAVEASSQYGWVIPFSQLTIHAGGPGESADSVPSQAKGRRLWGLWR